MINLQKYDIILVSYDTVLSEMKGKKYKKNLFRYNFLRIILDEANKIQNFHSKKSRAIMKLSGMSKWIVTGTPIENSVSDLYSFMHFLNY